MAITGRAVTAGGGGIANRLDFTYTGGTFNERTADGVVEFLETGILTMKKDTYVDVFMVGGGAGGVSIGTSSNGGAGGSGGRTRTIVNALLRKGVAYQVVIGAGGTGGGNSGGETSAFGYTVTGGTVANGGSGGGKGGVAANGQTNAGDGGSNGSDGGNVGSPTTGNPGKGQGATTQESLPKSRTEQETKLTRGPENRRRNSSDVSRNSKSSDSTRGRSSRSNSDRVGRHPSSRRRL